MFRVIFALLIPLLVWSCSSNLDQANQDFLRQYGQDVTRINKEREQLDQIHRAPGMAIIPPQEKSPWQDPSEILGVAGTDEYKSALIDTSKLKFNRGREFFPDMKTLMDNQGYNNLPPDMFDIRYLSANYPDSYNNSTVSFDDMVIPKQDVFGNATNMGEKNYALINTKILQQNVDYINSTTSPDDKEIRSTLVREQKQLDRKKKLNILGAEPKDKEVLAKDIKADDKKTEIKKVENKVTVSKKEESKFNLDFNSIINKITN